MTPAGPVPLLYGHALLADGWYSGQFGFEECELIADFILRRQGKVMVSTNDHPDTRRVFDGPAGDDGYPLLRRQPTAGRTAVTGELAIMSW